jgi:type II secretory pathway pseudopilin PulG
MKFLEELLYQVLYISEAVILLMVVIVFVVISLAGWSNRRQKERRSREDIQRLEEMIENSKRERDRRKAMSNPGERSRGRQ